MRIVLLTPAIVALSLAGAADARSRDGWSGRPTPPAGGWNRPGPTRAWNDHAQARPRWGGRIDGRWWAGARAPGGWGAYRRPVRGWVLPGYWQSPSWAINDWSAYGLPAPVAGYGWSRYYDDAVLVDGRGGVYDSIGGIGWDRYDGPDADYTYYDDGDAPGGYADRYPAPYGRDADDGVGGAVAGAVVGGVAGNLIAGRGDRLGGTLIGAGVGAAAGYAIDRNDRAGRVPPPPRGYAAPAYGAGYGADYAPPAGTTVYQSGSYGGRYAGTTYSGTSTYAPAYSAPTQTFVTTGVPVAMAGYYANGYYYPVTTVTTVTISGGNAVSEEVVEQSYRPARTKTYRYTKRRCRC